jgi:hypothetical protein
MSATAISTVTFSTVRTGWIVLPGFYGITESAIMDRRELLGILGATTAGLAAVIGGTARADEEGHKDDPHHKCADACAHCMHACEEGFHHCYRQVTSGKAGHAKAMHLCVDCAEICGTSAKLVARMSPLMVHTCRACAECCETCLTECEKFNDPEMKAVVESLRTCAKSCRDMVKGMNGTR